MSGAFVRSLHASAFLVLVGFTCLARAAAPPKMQPPDDKTLATIKEKTARLGREIDELKKQNVPDWKLTDVEIYHKAAVWVTAHQEWYKDYAKWTVTVLDQGLDRAATLKAGDAPWLKRDGTIYHGYRSAIDGSVQPYRVTLPKGFPGIKKVWRLDLVLHGRDDTITEVKFLRAGDSTAAPPEQDFVQLDVYGRGNNAYRWAGEQDVFEALTAFRASARQAYGWETIDSNRIVLRGFSMGGAGAWHLGLQHPGFWCSCSPGAGFTTTFGRVKNPDGKLPDYVVKCLGIYDAIDYAENVFDIPVVAYGGEIDPQREAMEAIRDKITPLGLKATFLIGPKMGHKYDPESFKTIIKLQGEQAAKGRDPYPEHVRFVTMTPTFGECFWVRVLRQEHQYERSLVDTEYVNGELKIKTENVRTLDLFPPSQWLNRDAISAEVDGKPMTFSVYSPHEPNWIELEKSRGEWAVRDVREIPKLAADGKYPGQCGPIDDAFNSAFLCVRGTGKPWNPAVQTLADAELDRFSHEWNKWFRGTLPVKRDTEITPQDLKTKNLILFGDPSSNALIAKALPNLPLKWTSNELVVDGKSYSSADHMPALIYPSPLQPWKYVVLNSGHTFHEADFKSTNRMLYPHFGDFALFKVGSGQGATGPDELVTAGLFDEQWQWPGGWKK